MQLSGLLEKLRGLFTPQFFISSVTPLFCFLLINGAILSLFSDAADDWVRNYFLLDSTSKTMAVVTVRGALVAVVLLVAAYLFSTLNLSLRQALEGKTLDRPGLRWLHTRLLNSEMERLRPLKDKLDFFRLFVWKLKRKSGIWEKKLTESRQAGVEKGKPPNPPMCDYPANPTTEPNKAIFESFADLDSKHTRGQIIKETELEKLVNLLAGQLNSYSTELPGAPQDIHDNSMRLENDFRRSFELIKYAVSRAENEYIRWFNEKEFNYSPYTLAPTQLGNIAESVNGYAFSRYGMNLDCFWTGFQKVLQGCKPFSDTLEDAKTQLDFMVSFFWLTVASTGFWIVVLPFVCHTWVPFLAAWVGGPALARLWYVIAVQNYRSFADLLRTSVNMFRFDLLKNLKIAPPLDSVAERRLWTELNRVIGYGEERFLSYKDS